MKGCGIVVESHYLDQSVELWSDNVARKTKILLRDVDMVQVGIFKGGKSYVGPGSVEVFNDKKYILDRENQTKICIDT